ncbi:MAG: hypothetical protein ACI38Q_03025 [Candidatus Bruticola sp.]
MDSSSNSGILSSEAKNSAQTNGSGLFASDQSATDNKKKLSNQQDDDLPAPVAYHLKAIPGSMPQESTQERILNAVKTISQKSQVFSSDSDTEIPSVDQSKPQITLLPQKDPKSSSKSSEDTVASTGRKASSKSDLSTESVRDEQPNGNLSSGPSISDGSVVYSHTLLTATASPSKVFPKIGGKHTLVAPNDSKKTIIFKLKSSNTAKAVSKILPISTQVKSAKTSNPYQTDYYLSAFLSMIFVVFTFLCLATCCLTFLWPEHLARLNLNFDTASHILLAEIAVLLLSSSFQSKFSSGFRKANFLGGLLVTAEMLIVLYFS